MMGEVDRLIEELSGRALPVKPSAQPLASFLLWTMGTGIYIGLLVAGLGLRDDIVPKLHMPLFAAEVGMLLAMILASTFSISLLSFPDLHQKRGWPYAPVAALVLFGIILLLESAQDTGSPKPGHNGMDCLLCILFSSLVPACLIFYWLRKMACTRPVMAGGVALLAATSIGCLALRLSEKTDSVSHLLEWHYLPMLLFSLGGLALGNRLLRW